MIPLDNGDCCLKKGEIVLVLNTGRIGMPFDGRGLFPLYLAMEAVNPHSSSLRRTGLLEGALTIM